MYKGNCQLIYHLLRTNTESYERAAYFQRRKKSRKYKRVLSAIMCSLTYCIQLKQIMNITLTGRLHVIEYHDRLFVFGPNDGVSLVSLYLQF